MICPLFSTNFTASQSKAYWAHWSLMKCDNNSMLNCVIVSRRMNKENDWIMIVPLFFDKFQFQSLSASVLVCLDFLFILLVICAHRLPKCCFVAWALHLFSNMNALIKAPAHYCFRCISTANKRIITSAKCELYSLLCENENLQSFAIHFETIALVFTAQWLWIWIDVGVKLLKSIAIKKKMRWFYWKENRSNVFEFFFFFRPMILWTGKWQP